jgi:hypothetical protein
LDGGTVLTNDIIDIGSKVIAFASLVGGAIWGLLKFVRRDELFPRVRFEVSARFLGEQDGQVLTEILAELENKGIVPVKFNDLEFKVRGLHKGDSLEDGPDAIRGQTNFPRLLREGTFVPDAWASSFIYPGVATEYNFITTLEPAVSYVRVEASFSYDRIGRSHRVAKVFKVETPRLYGEMPVWPGKSVPRTS